MKVNSQNWTWSLNNWPKSIEVLLGSWPTHVWSIIIVGQKEIDILCRNSTKFKVLKRPWQLTFWLKINKGSPLVIVNAIIVCQKENEILWGTAWSLKSEFDNNPDIDCPLGQGYIRESLKSSFRKFYCRYWDLIKEYVVSPQDEPPPLSQHL